MTHVSLFDGINEGLRCTDKPAFSVQYHPEASPGPTDSHYLFERFVDDDASRAKQRRRATRLSRMPKRTDIKSILIIGAGPIVIGQACEFDYSGVQACKALKDEGYRVILVNSNPATIMTDPGLADATYIEPITPDMVASIIAKEKPDALLPTMGGQTALNTAMALHRDGRLQEVRRRADRRQCRGDRQGRGPAAVPRGDGPRSGSNARRAKLVHNREEAIDALDACRPAGHHPPVLHAGRHRRRHRLQPRRIVRASSQGGIDASPVGEVLVEESVLGWKEYEMEVVRDRARQLHHHLLDRERRPDGHPHRRFASPSRRR